MTDAPVPRMCRRIRVAGGVCGRITTNADGWCRGAGCTGYRTEQPAAKAAAVDTTEQERPARPVRPRPIAVAGPVPLDPDEAYDIRVARKAVASFVAVHGGSNVAAEAELRSMLEDFLRKSYLQRSAEGYWRLIREGYRLVLFPDCEVLVGYATAHVERSWSQVKARVPSRVAKPRIRNRRTRVEIDPNVRVRGNQTRSGFKYVHGPIGIGDEVEVFESEAGIKGVGTVTDIDYAKELVYLAVDWASLKPAVDNSEV